MRERWRIELFGGLRAVQGEQTITRFRTQKTAALLAYLAYYPQAHPREVLIELLWPDSTLPAGRQSLRTALSSIRCQMESPDTAGNPILIADHASILLNPDVVTTDVRDFKAAIQAVQQSTGSTRSSTHSSAEQLKIWGDAVELYRGPLLPGYYEDWILPEQRCLEELFFQTVDQLVECLKQGGDHKRAIYYLQRALGVDPLREEAHRELMRLYAAQGQSAIALRQYHELETILDQQLHKVPSCATAELAQQIKAAATEFQANAAPVGYLPLQLTRFFGREEEIARLSEMLPDEKTRLVTLVGMGGSGKTRLGLEVAHQLTERWHGAVWFVALADLADSRLIAGAVRDVLRLTPVPAAEPLEQVVAALARHPSLLVLDNFEHLVEGGAALVRTLLERLPDLTVLVTSRQRLSVPGEYEFEVRPLPLPAATGTLEQWAQNASVELFVDRVQAARADFQLTEANTPTVMELCSRLEGIPLAIELAAARAHVLTPTQMLKHLTQRIDLFKSRQCDVTPRHRSLRAAIDWSYRLLAPELQRFFAQLWVFRGGWTVEAAQAVCEEPHALDYLEQLRGCSLIIAQESETEMRFRMLETLREFAVEQMTTEERAALERRHVEYYAQLAREVGPQLWSPRQLEYQSRITLEQDNLRAVVVWSLENIPELAVQLMTSIDLTATSLELRGWFERSLEIFDRNRSDSLATRARTLNALADLAIWQGDYTTARSYAEEGLSLWKELTGQPIISERNRVIRLSDALAYLAYIAMNQGDFKTAYSRAAESLTVQQAFWETLGAGIESTTPEIKSRFCEHLCLMGDIALRHGDFAKASSLLEQSVPLAREFCSQQVLATQLVFLADALRYQGDCEQAAMHLEESLALKRELPFQDELVFLSLGWLARQQGDCEQAATLFREGLVVVWRQGFKRGILHCLIALAGIATLQGQPARAARLFATVEEKFKVMEAIIFPADRIDYDRDATTARAALNKEAFTAAWGEGRSMSWERAVEYALEVCEGTEIEVSGHLSA